MPPTYLAVAGFDPLHDEGLAYAERLREAGIAVTLRQYGGTTHDFLRMSAVMPGIQEIYGELARSLAEAFAA
ncbi:Carboxylesterase NlhH [compost metagenome]